MVSEVISLASVILPKGIIYSTVPGHVFILFGTHCACLSQKPSTKQDQTRIKVCRSTPKVSSAVHVAKLVSCFLFFSL